MHNREKLIELYKSTDDAPDMTEVQENDFYLANAIRGKEDLLATILESKEYMCNCKYRDDNECRKSKEYYARLSELFDRFYDDVKSMYLLEPLNDWWGYGITVRVTGISLMLCHLLVVYDGNRATTDKYRTTGVLLSDEEYAIHTTETKMMTLDEFGKMYDVSADTVRQWIRRGKIKEALKFGSDWRIPGITDISDGKLHVGDYKWNEKLSNYPTEFPDINNYTNAIISGHKGKWQVIFGNENDDVLRNSIPLTVKEKEKLELYLISNPMVTCNNNYYGEIYQRFPLNYLTVGNAEHKPIDTDELIKMAEEFNDFFEEELNGKETKD